jgi:hypothetical protein
MLLDLTSRWKMGGRMPCRYAMAAAVSAATPSLARHVSRLRPPLLAERRCWESVPLGTYS